MQMQRGQDFILNKRILVIGLFIVLFAVIALVFLKINRKKDSSSSKGFPTNISCPDCNIIFVSFDTLRADHVHTYGYPKNTSPTIDAFAENGFVFENDISASSWTLPSSMSWFTGVYPSKHKILNKYTLLTPTKQEISSLKVLSPNMETLAEVLKKNGYNTGGFTGGAGVHSMFGYNQGFDTYIDDKDFAGFEYTYPKAIEWIKKHQTNQLFVFLHGYNIHGEYIPAGGYDYRFLDFKYNGKLTGSKEEEIELREQGLAEGKIFLTKDDVRFLTAIYDEKIQRADSEFAKFIEKYRNLGLLDKTIFILTSDHGEELYDHGQIDHGHSLYDEVIHVPLVITIPDAKGLKIPNQVRSIDLMPTLLDIIGVKPDENLKQQFQGVSLVPIMKGKNENLDAFSETDYRYATFKRSLRDVTGWKLVTDLETKINELYSLNKDKEEKNNLSDQYPDILTEIKSKLQNILNTF